MVLSSPRLASRLVELRDKYFVGRAAELDVFRGALEADGPGLLYVHGPGGVGKSVLLRAYARQAEQVKAAVVRLDARDLEPSPGGVLLGLRQALSLSHDSDPFEALADRERPVLLIDTFENLAPLDAWLRDSFLPLLPDTSLVVAAGRIPPSPAWRADPAWSELTRVMALRNLQPRDSRDYLTTRGVPDEQHAAVLEFTHGHPLALSLLADLLLHGGDQRSGDFRPEHAPDIVRALLERFIDDVPGPMHWRALAVAAHSRISTEALLCDVLGPEHGQPVFNWLRTLPFMEYGPRGLFPHDIARDVLDADLRWRDPATYFELHGRIRDWFVGQVRNKPATHQDAYFDLLYLVRHSIVSSRYYDWGSFGHAYAELARPADFAEIVAMVLRHEGEDSARIAQYWLDRRPTDFVAFWSSGGELIGFTAALHLEEVSEADRTADPAIATAWQHAQRHWPLRPGEGLMHHRFFVGRDGYQDLATHNMMAMVACTRWLTTPRLALTYAAVADIEHWLPMFDAIRFFRAPEADFDVGGHRYGVVAHDWRTDPVHVWIKAKVALDPTTVVEPATATPPLLALSEPDFDLAVRQALRDFTRPTLAENPLMRSRLVFEHAGNAEPTLVTLRALLRETAQEMRAHPREAKAYRAMASTYFEPAPTQELAAEQLGVPFNTYRYQLAAGIKRLTSLLWERELAAGNSAAFRL